VVLGWRPPLVWRQGADRPTAQENLWRTLAFWATATQIGYLVHQFMGKTMGPLRRLVIGFPYAPYAGWGGPPSRSFVGSGGGPFCVMNSFFMRFLCCSLHNGSGPNHGPLKTTCHRLRKRELSLSLLRKGWDEKHPLNKRPSQWPKLSFALHLENHARNAPVERCREDYSMHYVRSMPPAHVELAHSDLQFSRSCRMQSCHHPHRCCRRPPFHRWTTPKASLILRC
jgi:hypothetical protein